MTDLFSPAVDVYLHVKYGKFQQVHDRLLEVRAKILALESRHKEGGWLITAQVPVESVKEFEKYERKEKR